jgi:hypothetical protein
MDTGKIDFLKKELVAVLRQVPFHTQPLWGKMTLQQMIEHLSDSVRIASGRTVYPIVTTEENLQKMQDFLKSEKPFRPNTQNPLLPQVPPPVRNMNEAVALNELEEELNYFFSVFEANKNLTTTHPLFGVLEFEMNVLLLYKHAQHHLKQFGVAAH